MTHTAPCSSCGVPQVRRHHGKRVTCLACAMERNRRCMRAKRERVAAERRMRGKRCQTCDGPLPVPVSRNHRFCEACGAQRRLESQRKASRRHRAMRARHPSPNGPIAAGAFARSVADASLNRGRCDRRCECGRRYHLEELSTPCPNCHAHLFDNPLEARNVRHAA